MRILKLKTNKLFYNKWPYKVECKIAKANYIARLGLPRVKSWIDGDTKDNFLWKGANKEEVLQFINQLEPIATKDFQIRSESNTFSFYVKDPTILKEITSRFNKWIVTITEPANEAEYNFLVSNTAKKILCNSYPKGKYRYKIYIKPNMQPNNREQFLLWAQRYGDKFNILGSTKKWLAGDKKWAMDPFLYVLDDSTLSLTGLYLGSSVKKVEEFIPRSKINS